MISKIRADKTLKQYLYDVIEDEGIRVNVEESLTSEDFLAIKVDEYYMGLHSANPPKAVDFIALVDCTCDAYALYILELKNVNSPKHLNIKDIQEKFSRTIEDFIKVRYKHYFLNDRYKYKAIKLYLVSDAYRIGEHFKNYSEYRRYLDKINKKDSLRVERSLGSKIYKIRNMHVYIEYDIPPNPFIKKVT